MNKADEMLQDIGSYLDESVGKRDGDVPLAEPVLSIGQGQYEGRTRHLDACVIQLDRIIPDPNQPRRHFTQEELEQLAHSLKTKGQLQPIRVRWEESSERYMIIMGERRFRAAKLAGLTQLDCIAHSGPLTPDEILELQLIENCVRQDLNPIEQAQAFENLLAKKQCSARQLAQELRVNVSTISRSLSLLKLPQDIQKHIASGKIPPGVAREILKLKTDAEQRGMMKRYFAGELTSADATAAAVNHQSGTGKTTQQGTKKMMTVASGAIKIAISGRRKLTNLEIVSGLREAAEILESDGRSKSRKAA